MKLAPVQASDLKVVYNSRGQYIDLIARGRLPGNYHDISFRQQERYDGSLFFYLLAKKSSLSHRYDKPYEAKYRVLFQLPQPGFNNKTVLVQTSLATWEVPIRYDGSPVLDGGIRSPSVRSPVLSPLDRPVLDPSLASFRSSTPSMEAQFRPSTPAMDAPFRPRTSSLDASFRPSTPAMEAPFRSRTPAMDTPYRPSTPSTDTLFRPSTPSMNAPFRSSTPSTDMLPPIRKILGTGQNLIIQADIGDNTSEVCPVFDTEQFRMINCRVKDSIITWKFQWAKPPTRENGAQRIDISNSTRGYGSSNTVIQRYLVEGLYPNIRPKPIIRFNRHDMIYSEPLCA